MPRQTRRRPAAAFSLIELLVVIAILALLIGLTLPVLATARDAARQVESLSNLRQLMVGYSLYHGAHDGEVLRGVTPTSVDGRPVVVDTPSGHTLGMPVADRYPWRLAPYLDHVWDVLYPHAPAPPPPAAGDSDGEALLKAYDLSLTPGYGINSVYVGGHEGPFGGFVLDGGVKRANRGEHVVFHRGEVKRPSGLLVFAEAQARVGDAPPFDDPEAGFHYATPPRADGHRWEVKGNAIRSLTAAAIAGIPEGRAADATPVGHFDGHAAAVPLDRLEDMRLWANRADADDYDFNP